MNIDSHIAKVVELREEADKLPDDNPAALLKKIDLLSQCFLYVGRISSALDEEYKRIYATRKRVWAEARISASKDKEAHAELAVTELREAEAQAYGDSRRWRNAFESTQEEIHALKLRMRIDFAVDAQPAANAR